MIIEESILTPQILFIEKEEGSIFHREKEFERQIEVTRVLIIVVLANSIN